jgi:hypothetical protein
MGEYDGAGFPIAYCLLSTASAIHIGKRTKALTEWATCLKEKYKINQGLRTLIKIWQKY